MIEPYFTVKQGQQCCLKVRITLRNLGYVYDRRITAGTVAVFDRCLTELYCGSECCLCRIGTCIKQEILVAKLLQSCQCIVQLVLVCTATRQVLRQPL